MTRTPSRETEALALSPAASPKRHSYPLKGFSPPSDGSSPSPSTPKSATLSAPMSSGCVGSKNVPTINLASILSRASRLHAGESEGEDANPKGGGGGGSISGLSNHSGGGSHRGSMVSIIGIDSASAWNKPSKAGVVVTSSRQSRRRSSSSSATLAFAAATAASGLSSNTSSPKAGCASTPHSSSNTSPTNSATGQTGANQNNAGCVCGSATTCCNACGATTSAAAVSGGSGGQCTCGHSQTNAKGNCKDKKTNVLSTAATIRVLNILRHWVNKHIQDFEGDQGLKAKTVDFLEEIICNNNLLPSEHKAAISILRTLTKPPEAEKDRSLDLEFLLAVPKSPSLDTFDTVSAIDLAEQITFLDYQIVRSIRSEELLGQGWMKSDKERRSPHVNMVSTRFNAMSRLVASEIVRRSCLAERVAVIEKWVAVADICRCLHNYNGVLAICCAFTNSSVYRLKKTWEKLSKQTRQIVEKLQHMSSSEGRFKNMREAVHRCDPPCIPYLGMYLSDLTFIEEGTPNTTEENLINYSKMRMIAHVIREIKLFQQTPYKIEHNSRVCAYLLDPSKLLKDDHLFRMSLDLQPRAPQPGGGGSSGSSGGGGGGGFSIGSGGSSSSLGGATSGPDSGFGSSTRLTPSDSSSNA